MQQNPLSNSYAAIDLGSNSFHMVIAEPEGSSIRIIDSLRVPVRLGAGLDKNKNLKSATRELALDSLGQFAQRLRGVPLKQIRVVGTNTLRRAKDSNDFIKLAYGILGKHIEIISGREEARLIFFAVSHSQPEPETQRLVIDIGGGSTELVIGHGFKPTLMESINMGCVSYTNRFIPDEKISTSDIKKASLEAQLELQPIKKDYVDHGWQNVIGCSGTIKAVSRILSELGITDGEITRSGLRDLIRRIDKAGTVKALDLKSISSDRTAVISGGIGVLHGVMKTLRIDCIIASQVALREGLIFDMLGKAEHIDIQSQTIENMASRYAIEPLQANRVEKAVKRLFNDIEEPWQLDVESDLLLLQWTARLHEIGKAISHSQYHKHGAYILENSDLMGFSIAEQRALALLVRFHRRKIDLSAFDTIVDEVERDRLLRLLSILRLAVLLYRGRHAGNTESLKLKVRDNQLTVSASESWLEENPLTAAELAAEADRLLHIDFKLKVTKE